MLNYVLVRLPWFSPRLRRSTTLGHSGSMSTSTKAWPTWLLLIIALPVLITAIWAGAALWFDASAEPALAGLLLVSFLGVLTLLLTRVRPWRYTAGAVLLLTTLIGIWWWTLAPSNDRQWQADVARLPSAHIEGSSVRFDNFRSFHYGPGEAVDERWLSQSFDLDQLISLDVTLSSWGPEAYGHTIASWGFADGRQLAISIETRKEIGETFSAVGGFFRRFELYYVVGDESDLLGVRGLQRGEKLELYQLSTTPELARAMLLDYIAEINDLVEHPRWYNALLHNCTTVMWRHAKSAGSELPINWRLLANGYLPELAQARGLVSTAMPLAELRERSAIVPAIRAAQSVQDSPLAFSAAIRQGLPARPTRP